MSRARPNEPQVEQPPMHGVRRDSESRGGRSDVAQEVELCADAFGRHEELGGEDVRFAFERSVRGFADVLRTAHDWRAAALKALAHPMADLVGQSETAAARAFVRFPAVQVDP